MPIVINTNTAATVASIIRRRLTWRVMEDTIRKTLGISCMFMWIILAALSFGALSLVAGDGEAYDSRERQALCRCGGSRNKPFCDGTHWYMGFKHQMGDAPSFSPSDSAGGG